MTRLLIIFITLLFSVMALGQTVAPELSWIDKAIQAVASLETAGWVTSLTFVLELVFRLIKTEKPKSVLYLVADGCTLIGKLFTKIGITLDKILPQRVQK